MLNPGRPGVGDLEAVYDMQFLLFHDVPATVYRVVPDFGSAWKRRQGTSGTTRHNAVTVPERAAVAAVTPGSITERSAYA